MSENDSVYKILDGAARAWRYPRQLHEQGKDDEARAVERQSILSRVQLLRQCLENKGFTMVGRGGTTVYYKGRGRLEICSSDVNRPIVQCCIRLGIPVCDSTTIPDDQIIEVVGFPMAVTNPDPEPENGYNSFSYAPVDYVFRLYRELGATVYNLEVANDDSLVN